MNINALEQNNQAAGLYNIFGANSVNSVDPVTGYGAGGNAQKTGSSSGDTVTISTEARELFARKLQLLRTEDEQTEQVLTLGAGGAQESKPAVDSGLSSADREAAGVTEGGSGSAGGAAQGSAGSGGAGGGGGGDAEGSSADERQKELESQLQSLQGQLTGIMSGPEEPGEKVQKASPIENRINAVEAELQSMKAQAMKSAKG